MNDTAVHGGAVRWQHWRQIGIIAWTPVLIGSKPALAVAAPSVPPNRQGTDGQRQHQESLAPIRFLAAAADALDLLVEGRVFPGQGIVGIGKVLFRGNRAGARLAMADRG